MLLFAFHMCFSIFVCVLCTRVSVFVPPPPIPVVISIIISALCLVLFLLDPVVCCVCFVTHEDRSRSASAPMLGTVWTTGRCRVAVVL